MHLLRLLKILRVSLRYGLDEFFLGHERVRGLRPLLSAALFWRRLERPRGERLRLALEALGPIFVKFGQVLSTRRDLIPLDIANELAKLQDQVPPFPAEQVYRALERTYALPVDQVFERFDAVAIASASVAQVHLALLPGGREVAVKVLRPGIAPVIVEDIALLNVAASLIEKLWPDGRRLKPREVVAEFERHLKDELDLLREAANASQLRRNFENSSLLMVPEVFWDYCGTEVMVMERMIGTPISQVQKLRAQGIDIPKLARAGVEIFFTQVFRDGFFHADMHPGNILVASDGRYIALDFGIMGTLNEVDKNYLAQNFPERLVEYRFANRANGRLELFHPGFGRNPARLHMDLRDTPVVAPEKGQEILRQVILVDFVERAHDAEVERDVAAVGRNWCCCRKRCST